MTLILIKAFFYVALAILAYACVQTANAITKDSCKCNRIGLILMIVGCAAVTTSVFYNLSATWLLLSLLPLIIGVSFWLIVSNADMHHKLDKWFTLIKNDVIERVTTH